MNAEKMVKMFSVRPQSFSFVKKFRRLLQNQVQATHLFPEGDDLRWGAPGLGVDLGWGGKVTCGAQGCGGASCCHDRCLNACPSVHTPATKRLPKRLQV